MALKDFSPDEQAFLWALRYFFGLDNTSELLLRMFRAAFGDRHTNTSIQEDHELRSPESTTDRQILNAAAERARQVARDNNLSLPSPKRNLPFAAAGFPGDENTQTNTKLTQSSRKRKASSTDDATESPVQRNSARSNRQNNVEWTDDHRRALLQFKERCPEGFELSWEAHYIDLLIALFPETFSRFRTEAERLDLKAKAQRQLSEFMKGMRAEKWNRIIPRPVDSPEAARNKQAAIHAMKKRIKTTEEAMAKKKGITLEQIVADSIHPWSSRAKKRKDVVSQPATEKSIADSVLDTPSKPRTSTDQADRSAQGPVQFNESDEPEEEEATASKGKSPAHTDEADEPVQPGPLSSESPASDEGETTTVSSNFRLSLPAGTSNLVPAHDGDDMFDASGSDNDEFERLRLPEWARFANQWLSNHLNFASGRVMLDDMLPAMIRARYGDQLPAILQSTSQSGQVDIRAALSHVRGVVALAPVNAVPNIIDLEDVFSSRSSKLNGLQLVEQAFGRMIPMVHQGMVNFATDQANPVLDAFDANGQPAYFVDPTVPIYQHGGEVRRLDLRHKNTGLPGSAAVATAKMDAMICDFASCSECNPDADGSLEPRLPLVHARDVVGTEFVPQIEGAPNGLPFAEEGEQEVAFWDGFSRKVWVCSEGQCGRCSQE